MSPQLGAAPQQLPVAELYAALDTGVVHSQDHPRGWKTSRRLPTTR